MTNSNTGIYLWLEEKEEKTQIPTWKELDESLRKMAVLSLHEKDISNYIKMKEYIQ